MKLEAGMYVRTINGKIWIITSQKAISGHRKDIINASYNIMDLIEVGDYVNGKKVIDTFTDYIFDYSEEFKVIRFSETDILHNVKHIKSIVTHEQMEQIAYKVEE